jgi:hypothetical protein
MARRETTNRTGIDRLNGIPYHDAWVAYVCINCLSINYVNIGQDLISPDNAFDECIWVCDSCGFMHSRESDIPFQNWDEDHKAADSKSAEYFWRGFFRASTEHPESYWKQCNVCGRIMPFSAFSRHAGWGPLERQMECRACKGAINAILNPKRTSQQLHEASVRRRIADLLLEAENEPIDINELFQRFDNRCFKTKQPLVKEQRGSWAIDHILPSKWLYPLTRENAALLSTQANENKRDKWPSQFYTNSELIELALLTGADLSLLTQAVPVINKRIDVNKGVERYLQVREMSNLNKRIKEIKKIIRFYGLQDQLNEVNKRLLGFEE